MVGRLVPIKDVPTFLRAARIVPRSAAEARFALVGDGEERPALESLCRELGLDGKVTFFGWKRDLAAVYGDLDVVVNASRNEGTPVALIEALAAARPVVATRVGGTPDLLGEGERGRLVPPGEPEALARAVLETLDGVRGRAPLARGPVGSTSSRATRRTAWSATWTRSTASCARRRRRPERHRDDRAHPHRRPRRRLRPVRRPRAGGGVARAPLRGDGRARARARSTRRRRPASAGSRSGPRSRSWCSPATSACPSSRGCRGSQTHLAAPVAMLQEAYRVEGEADGAAPRRRDRLRWSASSTTCSATASRWASSSRARSLAAVVLVAGGIRTDFLYYDALNVALTLVWVVGITNAFNLLDNMDGLSAGVAFVASLVLLVNAWILGEFFISLVLVALMGSLLGFLVYNLHPASIFLGDCGSLFIGFTLASLTLLQRYVSHASSHPLPRPHAGAGARPADPRHRHRHLHPPARGPAHLRRRQPPPLPPPRLARDAPAARGLSPSTSIALGIGLGAVGLAHADLVHALLILVQALAVVAVVLILLFYERRAQPRREEP